MLNNVTIGQYFPIDSAVHKLDPRLKIILIMVSIAMLFVCQNYISLVIVLALILLILMLSGVPFKTYLKSMKSILPIIIFTGVLNIFYGVGEPIFSLGFMEITQDGINTGVFVSLRLLGLIFISSVLTFTTSPTDITDALERLMKPLSKLGIKTHEIAMMMTIALRFVPTLIEETDKIISAQKSRGADFESGNILQRMKAFSPIFVPLFISSFRRAYDLALAMESRCYRGGEGRTRLKILRIKGIDVAAMLIMIAVCAGVIFCNIKIPRVI